MTVFIDNECMARHGKLWCHLVADSLEDLHGFVAWLGLQRRRVQDKMSYLYYDVTTRVRERALRRGALPGGKVQAIGSAKLLRTELRALQATAVAEAA